MNWTEFPGEERISPPTESHGVPGEISRKNRGADCRGGGGGSGVEDHGGSETGSDHGGPETGSDQNRPGQVSSGMVAASPNDLCRVPHGEGVVCTPDGVRTSPWSSPVFPLNRK